MASYTTTKSGNWSDPTVFSPAVVPGAGDTVTITSGHTLTVDVAATIGTGTGVAITIGTNTDTGSHTYLIVNAPLACNGHIAGNPDGSHWAYVNLGPDAGIEFGGNTGFAPRAYAASGRGPLRFRFQGTTGHPAYLRSASGRADADKAAISVSSDPATFTESYDIASWISVGLEGSYGLITDLGNTVTFGVRCENMYLGVDTDRPTLDHTNFVRTNLHMSALHTDAGGTNAGLTLQDCTFTDTPIVASPPGGLAAGVQIYGRAADDSRRFDLVRCGFDQSVYFEQAGSVTDSVFARSYTKQTSGSFDFATAWSGNLFATDPFGAYTPTGVTVSDCYAIWRLAPNPWVLYAGPSVRITGCVLDAPVAPAIGEMIFAGDGLGSVEIDHNIVPPTMLGTNQGPGKLLSNNGAGADTSTAINVHHNTACVQGSEGGMIGIGENPNSDWAGYLPYVRDNIAWSDGTNPGTKDALVCDFKNADASVGCVGVADYNCGWNLVTSATDFIDTSTPATRVGYIHVKVTGSNLGDHDIQADPQFVDGSRNIVRYYREQVGATDPNYATGQTVATDIDKALDWFRLHPDQIATMLSWVRAGYVPQNEALRGAGHDSSDIGAMALAAPVTVATGRCPVDATETAAGIHVPNISATGIFRAGVWFQEIGANIAARPQDARSDAWIAMLADTSGGRNAARIYSNGYYDPGNTFFTVPFQVVDETVRRITCAGRIYNEQGQVAQTITQAWPLPVPPISQENNSTGDYLTTYPTGGDCHFLLLVVDSTTGLATELHEWYQLFVDKDIDGNITGLGCRAYRKLDIAGGPIPADCSDVITAGGLPFLPLMGTAQELVDGAINHPLRMAVNGHYLCSTYAFPAINHSTAFNPDGFPLGTRIRIRADRLATVLARFPAGHQARVVAQCLADYGGIVDDLVSSGWNGAWDLSIDIAVDDRIAPDLFTQLMKIDANDLEIVEVFQAVTFTGSQTVTVGQAATYTATAHFPAGYTFGAPLKFYGPRGYDLGSVDSNTPAVTAPVTFGYQGHYTPQVDVSGWAYWYVQPFPVTVVGSSGRMDTIDDADATLAGGWNYAAPSGSTYYADSFRYAADTSTVGSASASYRFTGLTASASYRAALTWLADSNRATAVPYQILDSDSTTILASGTIDQTAAPTDFTQNGVGWKWLDTVTPTGAMVTVRVQTSSDSDRYTIADAAYLADAAPPATYFVLATATGAWILKQQV